MDRQLVRWHRQRAFAYYRRVVMQAARETMHPWLGRFGTSAAVGALAAFASWSVSGPSALIRFGFAVAGFAGWLLLIFLWRVMTIPPRIEFEMQRKEETLQILSERTNLENTMRNYLAEVRAASVQAQVRVSESASRGATQFPGPIHDQAVHVVSRATEDLRNISKRTGHVSYDNQIVELTGAVRKNTCRNAEEAIAQLDNLGDILERQIFGRIYC